MVEPDDRDHAAVSRRSIARIAGWWPGVAADHTRRGRPARQREPGPALGIGHGDAGFLRDEPRRGDVPERQAAGLDEGVETGVREVRQCQRGAAEDPPDPDRLAHVGLPARPAGARQRDMGHGVDEALLALVRDRLAVAPDAGAPHGAVQLVPDRVEHDAHRRAGHRPPAPPRRRRTAARWRSSRCRRAGRRSRSGERGRPTPAPASRRWARCRAWRRCAPTPRPARRPPGTDRGSCAG